MAIIKNEIDKTLQAYSPSRLTVTAVTINSLSSSFLKAKNTNITSPSQIQLTASIVGFTTPTYTWYYSTSTNLSTWIAVSTGISLAVTNTLYNTHITSSTGNTFIRYKVVASQTGWTTAETYFDINYNQETNDLPVLTFTKDSIALPTTNADICTYTGASTDISVSIAGTALSYATTGNNTFNVTVGTLSGTGVVTPSTVGTVQTYTISGMNGTGLTATLTVPFTITARDARGAVTTFTKNIFVSKVTSGTAGVPGPSGDTAVFAYYVISSASLPASPTITQNATPAFGAVAAYSTWYLQPKATLASSDWQFQISGTKSAAGTYTWESSLTGYLSTFKVGALSALSADLGTVTAGTISTSGYGIFSGNSGSVALPGAINVEATVRAESSSVPGGAFAYRVGVFGSATAPIDAFKTNVGVAAYATKGSGAGIGLYAQGESLSIKAVGPSLFTGQIRNTVAVGTAPISVDSTTMCPNLNADRLDDKHASDFYLATNPSAFITAAGSCAFATSSTNATNAVNASTLDGFDSTDFPRYISVAPGSPGTAFTHVITFQVGTTGTQFRIPCFIP